MAWNTNVIINKYWWYSDLNYFDDLEIQCQELEEHITRNINFNRIDYTEYGSMSTSISATDLSTCENRSH